VRNQSLTPEKTECLESHPTLIENEKYSLTSECLKTHSISPYYRSKMVDWMIEVTTVFQCSTRTFFFAAKVMDKFFQIQNISVHPKLLHIIGAASIFIASKYEDVRPINLKDLKEKICHDKFSFEDFRITEQAILKKLGFFISFVTRADFIEEISVEFELPDCIRDFALFLSRLSMYFYNHLEYKESQIAYSCLIVTAKSLDKEDVVAKILSKCIQLKLYVNHEAFKNDIIKFKLEFPNLKRAFISSDMDFEIVDGNIMIKSLDR
jgi:Cyclin, N-terminal domain